SRIISKISTRKMRPPVKKKKETLLFLGKKKIHKPPPTARPAPPPKMCPFFSAIPCPRPDRGAGSCSYCSAGEGAASRGCETDYQKTKYRRYYLRFHLISPLDVITDPSLTTSG